MFKSITLEISLKPFKETTDEYIRTVVKKAYNDWAHLLSNRERISILMWCSDGSEILDYDGDLEKEFEWCKYVGTANNPYLEEGKDTSCSLHSRKQHYIDTPPRFTYRILKNIISIFKEEGKRLFPEAQIRVGETFDIGPEFAESDFKYNRHTEICTGSKLDKHGFVDATATLKGDSRKYAAYPNGIPDGEPFGLFLGRQSEVFLRDMGFDYLWLSNGLGFSADPWDSTGKIFDGKNYYPEKLEATKEKVFLFWKLFREGCPEIPLEVRGTNNSAGIDYASDGVPLYDIYRADLGITPPPNSPWAAINENFGLEIMGHMTRICELPDKDFMFRYYLHDPWWLNSPWYDRYDGAPSDIYLPMSIGRIDENGEVQSAENLNILSIDNSRGDMPISCVLEPLPHVLKAEKDAPDAIPPLVWVYPLREFTSAEDASLLKEMREGDTYIANCVNDSLPLCTVVSTDNFLRHNPALYCGKVLVSPVQPDQKVTEQLINATLLGAKVLFYGNKELLDTMPNRSGIEKVDISLSTKKMRETLTSFGYSFGYEKAADTMSPVISMSKSDGGYFFSAYNSNTTSTSYFKTPIGAPILIGRETVIKDGHSTYAFSRGEHRECRVFIEQSEGVILSREAAPVNARYRRKIYISGLKGATVRIFPEKDKEDKCILTLAPLMNYDEGLAPCSDLIPTEEHGEFFLKAENLTGSFFICME